ncbi:probable membrane-associated kinase regulator 4 [Coffea eugenioides]|uniref:Probable membrane-associated kinase regulator 4 n=1 Tax=Coffea arabica TaxID=13443 RepID=A0A6P6SWY2_COFAR|nr:probable membrane-associated kinase regulator 4 [Coffea arabica]XP_027176664.1 probable membrane-associated kinase regulator 4 [Coffea eugenioides]
MATYLSSCPDADEDYIDMEVSSCHSLFCCSEKASPQSREFEFQMSSSASNDRETTPSPADELFYKGKLLPLYLPPRLQMVQTLLQTPTISAYESRKEALANEDDHCGIPFIGSFTAPSTNTSTPLDSCNISPSESCRVSCELNPSEYFFGWSTELSSFIGAGGSHPKKSWSKKLKMIRQSSLTQKLKASRAYLKSLFRKSACSDESAAKAACNLEAEQVPGKYVKVGKKAPFGHFGRARPTLSNSVKNVDKEGIEENISQHRRSFSGAIKRHSPSKCLSSSSSSSSGSSSSSSSFSINSNVLYESHLLKRSSSAASDIEISIESAIAHCKNSQQIFNSRNTEDEAGFYSLPISRISPTENQEKAGVCKI